MRPRALLDEVSGLSTAYVWRFDADKTPLADKREKAPEA